MSEIETKALALIGTPFRLHGRDPARGLDCVGLVAAATGCAAPTGYRLRSGDAASVARQLESAGFRSVEEPLAGDVTLIDVGPGQLHLAVRVSAGFVHADAGLRRVAFRPGALQGEVIGSWRL